MNPKLLEENAKAKLAQPIVIIQDGSQKSNTPKIQTPKSASNSLIDHILNSFRGGNAFGNKNNLNLNLSTTTSA